MKIITVAYRVGSGYSLEPPSPDAEPVPLTLAPGIRVRPSAEGRDWLFHKDQDVSGRSLQEALSLGWCWLDEGSRAEPDHDTS